MIFTRRHFLRMALLAITLCLIVSTFGRTQEKTEVGEKSVESQNTFQPKSEEPFELGNLVRRFREEKGRDQRLFTSGDRNVIVFWDKDESKLRGFSVNTAKWTDLKIEKEGFQRALVTRDVAAARVGDKMVAYSGITGTWDVLKLNQGDDAKLMLTPTDVWVHDNNIVYQFEASTGKWSSPDNPNFPTSGETTDFGLENSGGGFGGRNGGFNQFRAGHLVVVGDRLIKSTNVMISWSKNNDELRGFSQKTGEWTNLKIEKQKSLDPIVGGDVAAVRVGDTMAAYSGTTGTWDVLKLSKGSQAEPTVSSTYVQTTDNDYLYTFAASKGKWTSPNDPKFRKSANNDNDDYERYLSASERYRSTIAGPGFGPGPGVGGHSGYGPSYPRGVEQSDESFDQDRATRMTPDQAGPAGRIVELTRKYRGSGLKDEEARQALTEAVGDAFDLRQKQQKAEAGRLAEKLQKIRDAIEKRESLREKIIERRVDELLDPNVEWDQTSRSGATVPLGASAFSSLAYPPPPGMTEETPVVQKLVTEQVAVEIDLADDAPQGSFEKGDCLVVAGLIQPAATQGLNDFELQRQEFSTRPTAANLDETAWNRFDLKKSIKVIHSSTDTEADQLPQKLTNSVVTEPLPKLISGGWPIEVVHPDLRNSLDHPPGNLVQFRVLDFNVKPGFYYRYRVRLATAVNGKKIWGDWSQPTKVTNIAVADGEE